MKITKIHPFTGQEVTREINIKEEDYNDWKQGEHIQIVAPYLSVSDREFMITGLSDEEFDEIFPEEEED